MLKQKYVRSAMLKAVHKIPRSRTDFALLALAIRMYLVLF